LISLSTTSIMAGIPENSYLRKKRAINRVTHEKV